MHDSAANEDKSFIEKEEAGLLKFCRLFTATLLISNHSSDTKTLIKDYMLLYQANIWLLPLTESSYVFLGRSRPLLHAILLHYIWCYSNCALKQNLNNATDDIMNLSCHLCPENLHPIYQTTEIFHITYQWNKSDDIVLLVTNNITRKLLCSRLKKNKVFWTVSTFTYSITLTSY